MNALEQLKAWNTCAIGYAFCEAKNVQTMDDIWQCLERPDWMLWLVNKLNLKLDEAKLRLFACDCAEGVLPNFESKYPDDKRPRQAIEVARRFARGEATREELESAMYAAGSAAMSAADAAGSAAMSAMSAAGYAAMSAADAARSAADAAMSAAGSAARSAARYAAQKKYADLFRTYFPTLPTGGTE